MCKTLFSLSAYKMKNILEYLMIQYLPILLVKYLDPDCLFSCSRQSFFVSQSQQTNFVNGITGIGDQLSQEDLEY